MLSKETKFLLKLALGEFIVNSCLWWSITHNKVQVIGPEITYKAVIAFWIITVLALWLALRTVLSRR